MSEEDNPQAFLDGCPTVDDFTGQCMKTIARATQASSGIPADKKQDWDYYTTFKSFRQIMGAERTKVRALMDRVLAWNGIKGKTPDNVADMMDFLTEANDQLLERINTNLDEAAGLKKEVDPMLMSVSVRGGPPVHVSGSWNKRKSLGGRGEPAESLSGSPVKLLTAKNVSRPQLKFKDLIDNSSSNPFIPRLKEKPNSKKPLSILPEYTEDNKEFYSHPYLYELNMLRVPKNQLAKGDPGKIVTLEEAQLFYVETPESLDKMIKQLKKEIEIAVDTEHHSYRTYLGLTSLIQISTRSQDYIVDPYPLWKELTALNEVFTDPKIVKIFHGADSDLKWLQRDFSVYIVNLFDTHLAAKRLDFPPGCRSFAYLLNFYCKLTTDKQFQLADWRIRPLSQDLVKYARTDTRYLIHIYHIMKNALIEAGNENNNLLVSTLDLGTVLCKTRYNKPEVTPQSHMELLRKCRMHFNSRQLYALKELYLWRDTTAREEDESDAYVLPVHMLLKICTELPREMQGILACCNPIPPLIKQNLQQIHMKILKAREQPLTMLRNEDAEGSASKAEIADFHSNVVEDPLKSPLDLGEVNNAMGVPVFLDGKECIDLGCSKVPRKGKATLSVFDTAKTPAMNKENDTSVKMFLSPYQRYQMLKPYLQFLNDKGNNKEESEVTDIDRVKSIQDHFAALTAMTADDFTREREGDKEEEEEQDQEEEEKKDEAHTKVVSDQVKPLRSGMTGKTKTKRKATSSAGSSGKQQQQQPPAKAAKTEVDVESASVDYDNVDLGQFGGNGAAGNNRGNKKNKKVAAGAVPPGQYNPWESQNNKKKGGGAGGKQKQRYRAGNKSVSYKK